MPEATPRPWPAVECTGPCDDYYSELYEIEGVAKFFGEADAELARRAVNSHDALVAAAAGCLDMIEHCGYGGANGRVEKQHIRALRAALAQAQEPAR